MIQPKRRLSKKKVSKKKGSFSIGIIRLFSFLVLFFILVFSVCSVGYVIFFRTAFASEIPMVRVSPPGKEMFDKSNASLHVVSVKWQTRTP
jgi:hypothetical protein